MTRLFLDCEWADPKAQHLVSIALVDAAGSRSFYAEVAPLPHTPTDFVKNVVYPLLDKDCALSCKEITKKLRDFIRDTPSPFVLFDHEEDGRLFQKALSGFDCPHDDFYGPLPGVSSTLVSFGDVTANIEEYFAIHPDYAKRRHHALVDAKALAWAFEKALRVGTR